MVIYRPGMSNAADPPLRLLDPARAGGRILLVVAAPTEARAVVHGVTGIEPAAMRILWDPIELSDRVDLVVTGVGKANAAGGTARVLSPQGHTAVVALGVGGALPEPDGTNDLRFHLQVGDAVRCDRSVFADEGVENGSGWQTMGQRGFGPRQGLTSEKEMAIDASSHLMTLLQPAVPRLAGCATVSTCSGTDSLAMRTAERSRCAVEAMEGAAVGLAVLRAAPQIPFIELRVISNQTGSDQRWDLPLALARLAEVASAL